MRFGEFLVHKNLISQEDLGGALSLQRYHREKLGRLLVELGKLSQDQLDTQLLAFKNPQCDKGVGDLLKMLQQEKRSIDIQERLTLRRLVFLGEYSNKYRILGSVFSDALQVELEREFEREIELLVTEKRKIDLLLGRITDHRPPITKGSDTYKNKTTITQASNTNDPYKALVSECIANARQLKASDIHFEPFEDHYAIRIRLHGRLTTWKEFSHQHGHQITSRLKFMTNMDLALIGLPQDSRASFPHLGIDIRASSMPVTGGEKIVLRLQYRDDAPNIRDLGLPTEKVETLLEGIKKSNGIILISGPTGSGKTTTLYALLEEMDRQGMNISTLEHPVEKNLKGINQANLSGSADFADFQRALMRQDPDVILLGEIRDKETADLSMKLSSTGHLVLSTVHANGAWEVIDRLQNLGLDPYTIRSNLRLSVAQRLLRLVCPGCSQSAPADLVRGLDDGRFRIVTPSGCEECQGGVVGRQAVIEVLDGAQIAAIETGPVFPEISLYDECLDLAKEGRIDVRDALTYA